MLGTTFPSLGKFDEALEKQGSIFRSPDWEAACHRMRRRSPGLLNCLQMKGSM